MQKFLATTLKIGLFLVPFLPLVVMRSLVFPFITGKHFLFRILVEILTLLWLILVLKYQQFVPKKSPIIIALAAFIGVLFLAMIFGMDPFRSFWSNYERMEGFVGLAHFFLYFLILSHVLTTEKDWLRFFYTTLAVSAYISIYAVLQLAGKLEIHQGGVRVDATLGNATYLAVYLLFHLYLLIYLFFKETIIWKRWIFAGLFTLQSIILYFTATRGAILAFVASLLFLAGVVVLRSQGKVRLVGATALAALLLLVGIFWMGRGTQFVRQSTVLSRFASISLEERTTQSRFIIWSMALKGWKERPILGWGQENFGYVFSKYYDPRLWKQEPWFDRAHNIVFDWLIVGGLIGLLSYLAIFGASFVVLRKLFKQGKMTSLGASIFIALFVAYFLQNFFVFDQFASYFLFFSILAYLHALAIRTEPLVAPEKEKVEPVKISRGLPAPLATALVVMLVPFAAFAIYKVNIKPYFVARAIIQALTTFAKQEGRNPSQNIDEAINIYNRAAALKTFGTTEVRDQITQVTSNIVSSSAIAQADKEKFVRFAISELEKQNARFPNDMRAKAFLSNIYSMAGLSDKAVAVAKEALAYSPKRQLFYFVMAEASLNKGDFGNAQEALKQALFLDVEYDQAIHNFAIASIAGGESKLAERVLRILLGTPIYPDPRYVNAYLRIGDLEKVSEVWRVLIKSQPSNTQYYLNLAGVLIKRGLREEAVQTLEEVKKINPSMTKDIDDAIRQVRSGVQL